MYLAELAREEADQLMRARRRLGRGLPLHLADLGTLDAAECRLFLDLLGEALARKTDALMSVEASSSDGSLRVRLEPVPDGAWVTLVTEYGRFSGHDHVITIGPARPVVAEVH
jgi:uncharacterized protein (TIGR02677 family)